MWLARHATILSLSGIFSRACTNIVTRVIPAAHALLTNKNIIVAVLASQTVNRSPMPEPITPNPLCRQSILPLLESLFSLPLPPICRPKTHHDFDARCLAEAHAEHYCLHEASSHANEQSHLTRMIDMIRTSMVVVDDNTRKTSDAEKPPLCAYKRGTSFIRSVPHATRLIDAPWHDSRGLSNHRACSNYTYIYDKKGSKDDAVCHGAQMSSSVLLNEVDCIVNH